MALLNLPAPFAEIDALVERGDLAGAKAALAPLALAKKNPALVDLIEVKIGLHEESLAPQIAMNRLLNLMRQDAKLAGAHELYREASQISYDAHSSSLSHSHPPPPIKPKP
jgi:hypothetical protein